MDSNSSTATGGVKLSLAQRLSSSLVATTNVRGPLTLGGSLKQGRVPPTLASAPATDMSSTQAALLLSRSEGGKGEPEPKRGGGLKVMAKREWQSGYIHSKRRDGSHAASTTLPFMETLRLSPAQEELLASGSFLYLRRRAGGGFYDLEVTPQSTVDPQDYFTLSSTGVTHFQRALQGATPTTPGVLDDRSVFYDLAQFTREHRVFSMIFDIPFFHTYRGMLEPCPPRTDRFGHPRQPLVFLDPQNFASYKGKGTNPGWKAFHTWKTAIASGRRERVAGALNDRLFLLHATLRTTLLSLVVECQVALGAKRVLGRSTSSSSSTPTPIASMFSITPGKTYTLGEFVDAQEAQAKVVYEVLHSFTAAVRELVRGACNDSLEAFLTSHGIKPGGKMTFMERSSLRTVCQKLSRFVRVADLLMKDTMLALVVGSMESLAAAISPPPHLVPPRVVKTLVDDKASDDGSAGVDALLAAVKKGGGGGGKGGGGGGGEGGGGSGKGRELSSALALPLFHVYFDFQPTAAKVVAAGKEGLVDGALPTKGSGAGAGAGGGSRPRGKRAALEAAISSSASLGVEEKKGEEGDEHAPPPPPPELEDALTADNLLTITPSISTLRKALRSLVTSATAMLSTPPPLLTHPDILPYLQAAADEGVGGGGGGSASAANAAAAGGEGGDGGILSVVSVNLADVATANKQYRRATSEAFKALESAFEGVWEFGEDYVPFGRTYFRNEASVSSNSIKGGGGVEEGGYTGGQSLEELEAAIEKYKGQIALFDGVPVQADIGIFRVNSKDLKAKMTPSPTACLAAIRALIPQVLRGLCESFNDEVRGMYVILSSSPTEVEPFVLKCATVERAAEKLPELKERSNYIRSLATLMLDNHWPMPDDLKAAFRVLNDGFLDLESAQGKAEAALEQDGAKFARKVEDSIPILKRDVLLVQESLGDPMIASTEVPVAKVCKYLRDAAARMEELKALGAKYAAQQTQLKQPVAEVEQIEFVAADLGVKLKLWESIAEFDKNTAAWKATPFSSIDADDMGKAVQLYLKTAARSEKMLVGNAACTRFKDTVEDFKSLLPVVQDLRNKALTPRHWKDIEATIGAEIDPQKSYTLGELLDLGVVQHQPAISTISTRATQEGALMDLFARKVTGVWGTLDFVVNSYKESKEVFVLGAADDVIAALDESLVNINTILGSRYCAPIRGEVEGYQKRLLLLSETLDEWLTCQKQWMYLESIFSADDIKRQLPEESKRFSAVDKSWRVVMKRTYGNPNALVSGTFKGLKETFVRHNETLDAIQKALEEYLETKRSAFPRFYFLSNEELLEILAQARDPQAVQPHLRKCFDALTLLEFGKEGGATPDILAMLSPENERIELTKNLKARGNVETWLMSVCDAMVASLNRVMREGVLDYARREAAYEAARAVEAEEAAKEGRPPVEKPGGRKEWVLSHPAQVVATVAQIMWSKETEMALKAGESGGDATEAMSKWYDKNVAQLRHLTALVRSNLSKIARLCIVALVTTDVHARDIIEEMVSENVAATSNPSGNFKWQQQLRYYWEDKVGRDGGLGDVLVRQSNAAIPYGYEYQGATTRLVITPLTDRCWMTITGAYNLKLGAAPAGPAGTGKTESSKDLAKAIGIQCIVFNCSDQIDYKMMGKLFSGLAQSSSWTCLDEFNRIEVEVLSVVAQQVQQLRKGIIEGRTQMEFEGRTIALKPHMVIITMNPGYAGRTELPDNLKVLFRGVSMMVPDYGLIAEIMLFSEGFDDSKTLSRKMVKLYKLSSEQLSQQRHYDFGMRAVKTVLVMAGALKRSNPQLTEDAVLIRAMRDSNVPKFLVDDLPLFHAIVSDLFPGVHVPQNDSGSLQSEILAQLKLAGLQADAPAYNVKIMQLFEIFQVRFGAVLTGNTFSGKSTSFRTLAKAMEVLKARGETDEAYQKVHFTVLNPKCITMGELYGEVNMATQEWTDGLASTIIRGYVAPPVGGTPDDKRWTVFDGPIDALWIENMNTVLDDNMTLCLANGERIKLKVQMRMLFEVNDLDVASPATVSRLGVVFMTPTDLGWLPYVQSWIPKELGDMPEDLKEHLLALFEGTLGAGLKFRRTECTEPITTTDTQTAASLCRLFTSMLRGAGVKKEGTTPGYNFAAPGVPPEEHRRVVETLYAFAYVWTVGGSISSDCFPKFDGFVRGGGLKASPLGALRWGPGTVYDCFPDVSQPEVPWKKWLDVVPAFAYDRTQPYFAMVVPTLDTVRFNYLLEMQLAQLYPVFFTGMTGTGKTVVIQDFLNRASAMEYRESQPVAPININFSARTSALSVQAAVEAKLEKKKKTQLGAPAGKRVVIFVDDVNMPTVETYGAQPPVELMRQYADHKGFYDRSKLFWKDVVDTVIVGAAAPPGGGRAKVTPRFTRHFHVLCLPPASDDVLKTIFTAIFHGWSSAHAQDIRDLGGRVVSATTETFNRVRDTMRPTPSKSHYTFNLRDVSKVFQGVLMIGVKELGGSPDLLARLWCHECMRVFHDRLTDAKDKNAFTAMMEELLKRTFLKSGAGWTHADLFEKQSILFVDFLRPAVEDGPGPYEEVTDYKKVISLLDDALDEYNLTYPSQMKLVFFRDAVEHITRIKRILRQPRGNALLVGVGGSGKQSLTRMACHMSGVALYQIELVRGYGLTEFREDIKKMMLTTGVGGKPVAFLFLDTQIVNEAFLEDVSNVLNTGEVSGIFASDEMSKIIEDMRPVAAAANLPDTRDTLFRLFVQRVRDNLHIILAMSPVGSSLRVRCRQFPSLINCTTIDWFMPWPEDALASVAARFLEGEELGTPEHKAAISRMCVTIHSSVATFSDRFYAELLRKVYTTPKSYLDLINLYLSMLGEKRAQLEDLRQTLAVGTKKLDETNAVVDNLKTELTKLQPFIDKKTVEAAELLVVVTRDKAEADIIKVKVEKDASEVAVQAAEVKAAKDDVQKDLDVAMPALNAAKLALAKLDKKDIQEVKSFPKPPPAVVVVLEAVCLLLEEKMDWDTAKVVMSRANFMQTLLEYKSGEVDPAILRKLQRYIKDPMCDPEAVGRVSSAAKTLAIWVHAVDVYSRVAKDVEPKQAKVAEMTTKLNGVLAVLQTKQDALQAVLDKVAALEKQASDTTAEKQRLLDESQLTRDRLERANMLTKGLSSEGVRWKASVEVFDTQINNLLGDVLLSAACISYFGAFTGTYRAEMVALWLENMTTQGIPASPNCSLVATMGDGVQIRDWQIAGLPTDAVSTDNAILVTRGKRWPLMIDPQEQAKKWVKKMEERNKIAITRLSNPNMLRTLETCIRLGHPLLLEDVEETLDPALEPVLQKAVFKQGGRTLIHLGDSDIDYDPGFKLYMTTKLPNPHYLPEVCIKVTIINFTVTTSGLVDQLLGAVVKKERPDVERKKNDLVVSMAKDKKQLKDLEDKILRLLRESQGNILDDKVLIETLAESKELSTVISERLVESEATEKEINDMREGYRPVAIRGSLLYFVIADLGFIDPMYQFSLSFFAALFNRCIDLAEKSTDLATRLDSLKAFLTNASYVNICRGLFERDKALYSFLMCITILREEGKVGEVEWGLLLRGAGMVVAPVPNPFTGDGLAESGWNLCAALEAGIPAFGGFLDHLTAPENSKEWRAWLSCLDPQSTPLPHPWNLNLNQLQTMLVLKAFREEKVIFAVKSFVAGNLGETFVQSPPVSLPDVMKDTRSDIPVVFILSTGADPTGMLFSYAKSQNYLARLHIISLGQGQGPRAQALITSACQSGDWVLLQNCHLAKTWMKSLEAIVDGLGEKVAADAAALAAGTSSKASIHPDFRLFLTSMPVEFFPVPVLQVGQKLTNEPPRGIRANLIRTFGQLESWTPFETCDAPGATMDDGNGNIVPKLTAWKKLCFGMCFFHSIVQERRKFGPLGFNVKYEFNDSDLETSLLVLKMLLAEQPLIPWDAIRYSSAVLAYGGRVTDGLDLVCVKSIILRFICNDILEEGYKFSPSGAYYAPAALGIDKFTEYSASLPNNDNPEIFGLHLNANIASQKNETMLLLNTVLDLQPRSSGKGGGRTPDEIVGDLARTIEAELPALLDVETAGPTTFQRKGEHMDSLGTVLSQELARFNILLKTMASTLVEIQRAIRGEVLLSEELDKMYTSMMNNKVPANWEVAAYPSLKPLASWIKDLHARMVFMRHWLENGPPPAFWISGFFFPQGFLTGVLQNHARKYAIAIDTLNFSFSVLTCDGPEGLAEDGSDVPGDGVLVYGCFFDGARWDRERHCVTDSRPGEINSPMPLMHFMPTKDYKPNPKEYSAPMYKTSVRAGVLSTTGMSTNYVLSCELPTEVAPETWTMAGAALLTMLND